MGDLGEFASPPGSPKPAKTNRYKYKNGKGWSKKGKNESAVETAHMYGEDAEFTAWDGEGYTETEIDIVERVLEAKSEDVMWGINDGYGAPSDRHHYMLFGSSAEDPIKRRSLGTKECLDHIVEVVEKHPNNINVSFSFEYDVNMILGDLPSQNLRVLKATGITAFKGYTIKHIPKKIFSIEKRKNKRLQIEGSPRITIYDIWSFFNTKFTTALSDWDACSSEELERIMAGKDKRGVNRYEDMEEIEKYWRDEMHSMVGLVNKMREAFFEAGYFISDWHGPGALATYMLKCNKVYKHKSNEKTVPLSVKKARAHAYAGGRFQPFHGGYYIGKVYGADINSAYITAATMLPSLASGKWNHRNTAELEESRRVPDFGLYRIEWDNLRLPNSQRPQPFFYRRKSGQLSWPARGEGWYWGPEVNVGFNAKLDSMRIKEAWVWDGDGTEPFRNFIEWAYQKRLEAKDKGERIEKTYKWSLSAIYGQWARRVGWDRKHCLAPKSHQLEWAGFITSWCRAKVQDVAMRTGVKNVISINTDGIYSLVPFKGLDVGKQLGQWSVDEYEGIVQWSSGVYWLLKKDGTWVSRTRGVKRGGGSREDAIQAIERMDKEPYSHFKGNDCVVNEQRNMFVGYRAALMGFNMESWRTWNPVERESIFGGGHHLAPMCVKCSGHNEVPMHNFWNTDPEDPLGEMSKEHELPWLMPQEDDNTFAIEGARMFDLDDGQYEEILHDLDMEDTL